MALERVEGIVTAIDFELAAYNRTMLFDGKRFNVLTAQQLSQNTWRVSLFREVPNDAITGDLITSLNIDVESSIDDDLTIPDYLMDDGA